MKWQTAESCRHMVLIMHRHRDWADRHSQKQSRIHFVTGFSLFALQPTTLAFRNLLIPQNGLLRLTVIGNKRPFLSSDLVSDGTASGLQGADSMSSLLFTIWVRIWFQISPKEQLYECDLLSETIWCEGFSTVADVNRSEDIVELITVVFFD